MLDLNRPSLFVPARSASLATLAALCVLGTSCYSPAELRDRADRDAFALIDARRARLFNDTGPFALPVVTAAFGRETLDNPAPATVRDQVLTGVSDRIGPVDLVDALAIAAENSERVQQQKESLYLAALDLTEDQWRFGTRYNADGSGTLSGDIGGESATAGGAFTGSVSRVLGSGATILGSIGSNLFRFVSTGDGWDAVSSIGLDITQPLLSGSGRLVTLEPLRQAERNLIYSVRDYERFRRTYAVEVASSVYRTLQSQDQLKNETDNLTNLELLRKRNEALAEAGDLSEIQADQARQDELRSQNRVVALQGNVERQLDTFKVFLGLTVDAEFDFSEGILKSLASDGSFLDGLDNEMVVQFALDHRLDVMTAFDEVQDTVRREAIARDALRAGLGLGLGVNSTSDDGRPLGHTSNDANFAASVDLDLPVDLLPARNAWRRAEIALVNRRRSYERFLDDVTVSVRDALRRARNSFESLRIQKGAVELSVRRLRGASLSLEAGLATTRDVLEAQESLRQVRDAETSARIDFTLALLDLMLELEVLRVDQDGIHPDADLLVELRAR